MTSPDDLQQLLPPFAHNLGIRLIEASPQRVIGEMDITPEMANRNGVLHGGAVMGLTDSLGGTAAALNLSEGQATTTLESKTNFLRPLRIGTKVTGSCEVVHCGRKTMVIKITLFREDNKIAAITNQTQLTMSTWSGD